MISAETVKAAMPFVLREIDLPGLGPKQSGKVRDFYVADGRRVLVTTDRQSAFDVNLGCIPYKGAVLNQLAAFWFEQTRGIIPNHFLAAPDPNVTIARECQPVPIEMIVRGYLTGVTGTSIWGSYARGERVIYGLEFPDGLVKNQELPRPVLTPTTHGGGASGHDERLTREEIIARRLVPDVVYAQMERAALDLFDVGSKLCRERGLILVDTKYEFGLVDGELVVMDEIHTPDSSRFWRAASYAERFASGQEPENRDKEMLRLWFKERGYSGDGPPPPMSDEIVVSMAQAYVEAYETITGRTFEAFSYPIEDRVRKNVAAWFAAPRGLTYAQSGVDVAAGDRASDEAVAQSRSTYRPETSEINGVPVFAARFAGMTDPVLLGAADGVGTKLKLAFEMGTYDTVGIDLVAMCVNDLARRGAEPLFFLPYLALHKIDVAVTNAIMAGVAAGCREANCAIIGGETAEMGDLYHRGEFDLAGSAAGVVERSRLITGKRVAAGDLLFGVPSSGLHSNGFSLVRAALFPGHDLDEPFEGRALGEVLLEPTRIYVQQMNALMASGAEIHGAAHVTGGGLSGRLRKLMPPGLGARVRRSAWTPPPIFALVQRAGNVAEAELFNTLNLGIGFALAAPPDQAAAIRAAFPDALVIGDVVQQPEPFTLV
jgi:phosphoribosylaminoimidazole-succinocarboxamide synthase